MSKSPDMDRPVRCHRCRRVVVITDTRPSHEGPLCNRKVRECKRRGKAWRR